MSLPLTSIPAVQGPGLLSPFAGQVVRVRGVVTGHSRRGYFVQAATRSPDPRVSDGVFVFSPRRKPKVGMLIELSGQVLDFARGDDGRPTTQIKAFETRRIDNDGPPIEPVWLTAELLPEDPAELAVVLNGLEGMLVGVPAGSVFAAPSNPFGDYVCAPPGLVAPRTTDGGVLVDPRYPDRWLPGFRIVRYRDAPRLNVGAVLGEPVIGPLSYRGEAFQMVASGPLVVRDRPLDLRRTTLEPSEQGTTILTLNGFNLDVQIEDRGRVQDPDRDVDDDKLYGRFELLARAIIEQAATPDIVCLQEIQDDDGAELGPTVDATETYRQLQRDITWLGGPRYRWADIPPAPGADGGQPGGNIRNAFLFNPARVELVEGSLRRVGGDAPAFEGSRKPLLARFRVRSSGAELAVVNVHLASKRHQHSIFAPTQPGFDPREDTRVEQGRLVREALEPAREAGVDTYVTGDFNDFEFSATLAAIRGDDVNLVDTLPREQRYDYNHRGQLQVLMHGVVSRRMWDAGAAEYEILHGNELAGVQPGDLGGKATDHAYVIARLRVGG